MASYDVAVWPRSENIWPETVLIVQAETAMDAVIATLHARRVRRAVKVAVNASDGCIHRWYGVTRLADGFAYQHVTCLPMGWPDE
jgi:hypothetical protein